MKRAVATCYCPKAGFAQTSKTRGAKQLTMKSKTYNPQFCNTGLPRQSAATAGATLCFVNELTIDADGWAMIAPLGDFPSEALLPTDSGGLKRQKAIQRITKESAEGMVAQFHNSRAGLKKFIRGCNIYLGHPDMPGLESRYPDKTSKGVFADMAVREKGIYGLPVFTNEGMDLVEGRKLVNGQKVRGFSGRLVDSVPDGESNGLPVYCPTKIVSAGLTPYPHLPVEFFNADDTLAESSVDSANVTTKNKHNATMKKKLIALLAALSLKPQFANANEPTEGETETALDLINEKVVAFANEKQTLTDKVTGLETEKTKLANDLTAAQAATAAARAEFANERTARIGDLVGAALATGRITAADKPVWEGRLKVAAQFANESTALAALKPVVKTASVTVNRGGREMQVDVSDARVRRQFVNEVQTEIAAELKLDPAKDARRIAAIAQQRHPALFANIPHVEIKLPRSKN